MGDITNFQFNTHAIRVVTLDGEPWFVAADVCATLELPGYPSAHTDRLEGDEKLTLPRTDSRLNGLRDRLFRPKQPAITFVSEPGLYKLISRSNKPEAKAFDRWVRHEVLPAIRRDGAYIAGEDGCSRAALNYPPP